VRFGELIENGAYDQSDLLIKAWGRTVKGLHRFDKKL